MSKVLFDSSCVYATLNPTLEPSLSEQFPPKSRICAYYTSQYLRMEFMRRWIILGIQIYFHARQTHSIPITFNYFSNRFSGRENKMVLKWSAHYMQSIIEKQTSPNEPIERFGRKVYELALLYDYIFEATVLPKTSCKRGEVQMSEDSPTIRDALRDFLERFGSATFSCKINSLLLLHQDGSFLVKKILQADPKKFYKEAATSLHHLQKRLTNLHSKHKQLNCDTCYKLGDLLVAIDQPPKTTLLHTDHSFSVICPILKHQHQLLKSVLATSPPVLEST